MIVVLLLFVILLSAGRILVLQQRVRTLEQHAIRDPLTGAFNRRHMRDMLVTAVERHRRSGDRMSLLAIDIDRFKALNDGSGHGEGDRVLLGMAAAIGQRLRKTDALFRVGGDEFVVLLSGARLSDARAVAEQLRGAVDVTTVGTSRSVSISVGVAELEPEESAGEWLEAADAALYQAKHAGRNRVAVRVGRQAAARQRVS